MIYIDSDFKCHVTNPEGAYQSVDTDVFDGKCDAYIEGYRYIPEGQSWTREDGTVFFGEMLAPWKDYTELEAFQKVYEEQQRDTRIAALEEENAVLMECLLEMSEAVYA